MTRAPRTRLILTLILGAGLFLHLASAIGVYVLRPESISTTPDPLDYRLAALNLLDHGQFSFAAPEFDAPQLLRTPLYPAVLAATYLLDGRTGLVMILIQSSLVILMGWLLFRLLLVFRIPERVALILVAFYVFEPLQWLYTLHTMTETFSSFLLLTLTLFALAAKGISDWRRAALFGVGLGLLVLIKPSATMWIPFMLVLIPAGTAAGVKEKAVRILVALCFVLATLSPWIVRNYGLTGYAVVSSSSPFNIIYFAGTPETTPATYEDAVEYASYNGHTNKVWYAYTTHAYPMLLEGKRAVLEQADYTSLIMRQIAYAPTVWFGFTSLQNEMSYGHNYSLIARFAAGTNEVRDRVIDRADTVLWSVLLVLTLLGSMLMLRDRTLRWQYLPLLGMLLATVFINLTASWARMLLPMYPAVLIAVGTAMAFILDRRKRSGSRSTPV